MRAHIKKKMKKTYGLSTTKKQKNLSSTKSMTASLSHQLNTHIHEQIKLRTVKYSKCINTKITFISKIVNQFKYFKTKRHKNPPQ